MIWRKILGLAAGLALVAGGAAAQSLRPYGISGDELYNLLKSEGVTLAIWPQRSLAMVDFDDAGDGQAIGLSSGGFVQGGGHPCQYSLVQGGEKAIRGRRDVQAHHFELKAAGIKQLVFWADNRGAGDLCNAMIDTI